MIIDTDKLRDAIDEHEEKLLQSRYGGSWETCPMSFLNSSEKRVITGKNMVADVERLAKTMLGEEEITPTFCPYKKCDHFKKCGHCSGSCEYYLKTT